MTNEQLHQIDQARRYAEQDEYVVTRTHIRNLLAIIEQCAAAHHVGKIYGFSTLHGPLAQFYDVLPVGTLLYVLPQQATTEVESCDTPDRLLGD